MNELKNPEMRRDERGIALLVVLFATLLLTVIGLGMMYSTNMETAINSNYRDSQVALYSALAGLQQARERIKFPYDIEPPTQLPALDFPNVIYIVSDASIVKPWEVGNEYFDTELCHGNVLGLTGTVGVPCTETVDASNEDWRLVVDNAADGGTWDLAYPLDWKWTRIQLKGNNSTPVAVNGDSTDGSQACWNGRTQMSTPTSYTDGCQPSGGVVSIIVDTPGAGYPASEVPPVTLAGGEGSGATATAVMDEEETGVITAVTVDAGGVGYTSPPTVTFSSGAATAVAVLATTGATDVTGGTVTSATIVDGGSGYTTPPTVTFASGVGSGATATAVLSTTGTLTTTGYVNTATITNGGSGYTSAPNVVFTGGGGGGANGTAVLASAGSIKTVTLASAGTQCYAQASDAVISFTGGGGTGAAASAVLETGRSCIYSVAVTSSPQCSAKLDAMNGYSPIDEKSGVTFAASGQNKSFSGTLFVSSANDKTPTSMSVQNPGYDASGYDDPTLSSQLELMSGAWADCGNITVTATTGYRIASINVTNGGSGYTSDPTISITGGVGSTSNPTATLTRGFPISSVTMSSGGTNYTSAPSISFTAGGGGSGAAATATIITTSTWTYPVASITITNGGIGYTTAPAISLSGGGGSGATATAGITETTVTTYPIESITVTSGGTGYDDGSPPTITLTGGGGSGAAATPTVTMTATGLYYVVSITVDAQGAGYTSNPTITIDPPSGGGGSAATATAQVSGGTKYGKIWLLTSLAQTATGARAMAQMEVASPVLGFALGGALTLAGPNPVIFTMPNADGFVVDGSDANMCGDPEAEEDHPAIDGFDDPNANPPTSSVETIIDALPKPENYTGAGGTPSVQNGYAALGETMGTPAGLEAVIGAIYNTPGANHYTSANVDTFDPDDTTDTSISYVDGDLALTGNGSGRGILVVTGILEMSGNFSWTGLIFVVGDGHAEMAGGGTGGIYGSIFVAKIWDAMNVLLEEMGSPTFDWNGGGGNFIKYDHCYATNLMTAVPPINYNSTRPLKVLSYKMLPY
jgi:hypothetical protein